MSINTGTDITGLNANTAYTFYCYPINKNGQESASTYVTFTTPGIITSFSKGTTTFDTIPITYSGTYSKVKVYYSTTSGGTDNNVIITGSSTTSGSITGLISGTRYYLNIYPINSAEQLGTKYAVELNAITSSVITYTKYTSGSNTGNDNVNFYKYYNYFNYPTYNSTGNLTKASNTFTLDAVSYSSSSAAMIIWSFSFTPDVTGTWYFGGYAVDDQLSFYLNSTPITGHEPDVSYIFAANGACAGYFGDACGSYYVTNNNTYYAKLVYVNTYGGRGFTFKYGRPSTDGGTGTNVSSSMSSDFTNYI